MCIGDSGKERIIAIECDDGGILFLDPFGELAAQATLACGISALFSIPDLKSPSLQEQMKETSRS